jgi:hypothetical protein
MCVCVCVCMHLCMCVCVYETVGGLESCNIWPATRSLNGTSTLCTDEMIFSLIFTFLILQHLACH